MFKRQCPECGVEIEYKNKYSLKTGEKKKTLCNRCTGIKKAKNFDYVGENNPFYGKKHSKETIEKIKNRDMSSYKTEEFRDKIRKVSKIGEMAGDWYNFTVKKYGKVEADRRMSAAKVKWSKASSGKNNPMYGKSSPKKSGNGWSGWYKGWYFRSLIELTYMIDVIEKNNLEWINAESKKYTIEYQFEGKDKTYRADFIINNKMMVECKPHQLQNTPIVLAKKEAAEKWCSENNLEYVLVDIEKIKEDRLIQMYLDGLVTFIKKYEDRINKIIEKKYV